MRSDKDGPACSRMGSTRPHCRQFTQGNIFCSGELTSYIIATALALGPNMVLQCYKQTVVPRSFVSVRVTMALYQTLLSAQV
jgi:hypothetical protein